MTLAKAPASVVVEPVRVGRSGQQLFAMLHRPRASKPSLCIVMLNAGMQNRAGPQRLYWKFAQQAASDQIAVLRVDLAGVGDCEKDNPACHFDAHDKADVAAAVDYVRHRFDNCRIVLLGLCAGSRVAFKAAAEDADIDGLIAWSTTIITAAQNSPQSPYEPEDRMSEVVVAQKMKGIVRFVTRLRFLNPFWWRKKFPNFKGIGTEIKQRANVLRRAIGGVDTSATRNEFLDAVDDYLKKERKVLFVYGERDVRPLQEFEERFASVERADTGVQRLHVVDNGTHTFSTVDAQRDAIRVSVAWIDEYYGKASDAEPEPLQRAAP